MGLVFTGIDEHLGGLGSHMAEMLGCQDTRLNDGGSDEVDSKIVRLYLRCALAG